MRTAKTAMNSATCLSKLEYGDPVKTALNLATAQDKLIIRLDISTLRSGIMEPQGRSRRIRVDADSVNTCYFKSKDRRSTNSRIITKAMNFDKPFRTANY